MKHCDNCGGRFGMIVRRKWSRRFCSRACKTAFERRQYEEFPRRMRELIKLSGFPRSGTSHATDCAGITSGKLKFVLFVLVVLGTASAGLAMAQSPTRGRPTLVSQPPDQLIAYGSNPIPPDPDRNQHRSAVYFEPAPAPFNAYTYSASAQLVASGAKRSLRAEFRFPVFKTTPTVSVQIISSISAVPMRVRAVKISEMSGLAETLSSSPMVSASGAPRQLACALCGCTRDSELRDRTF